MGDRTVSEELDKRILKELSEEISLEKLQASLSDDVIQISKEKTFPKFMERLKMFEYEDLETLENMAELEESKRITTATCGAWSYRLLEDDPIYLFSEPFFSERRNFHESLIFLKEFLRRWSGRGFPKEFIKKLEFDELLNIVGPDIRKMPKYFSASLLSLFQGHPELSLYFATLAADLADKLNIKEKIEVQFTEALFYKFLKSSLAEKKVEKVCRFVDTLPNWERISESRAIVKKISGEGYFLDNIILCKESNNIEDLEAETIMADFLGYMNINTTTPLLISNKSDKISKYFFVCIAGKVLLDYLIGDNKESMYSCIRTIQQVHFTVPKDKVRFGKLDLKKACEERFKNPNLPLPENIINKLRSWYDFIIPFFESEQSLWRYSMDSHPENILIDIWKRVNIIDTENKYLAPVVFDLANLLGYGKHFSYEEKKHWSRRYFDLMHYNQKNINVSEDKFNLLFWNSLIHRPYFLSVAWSDPNRKGLHDKRINLIQNAFNAKDVIKQDFNSFYKNNKNFYLELDDALKYIEGLLFSEF